MSGRGSSSSTCPVGVFCALLCWNNLKSQETPTRKLPIDRVGLLLLFVWVGALQIMLDKGKDLDWFNSPAHRGRCSSSPSLPSPPG